MKKIKIGLLFALISSFVLNLNAVIAMNDLECIFSENPEKSLIKDNVISGAIGFLLSKSYSDLILMEYEKSAKETFNYPAVLDHLDKTISALEGSKESYIKAKEIGERLGYMENKISWFKGFNYDEFISTNKLNNDIALKVKSYLSKSDVIGLYQENINNITDILNTLYYIKSNVSSNVKPDISVMWKLLHQYSEALLWGNYSTMMGGKILSNCED